MADTDNVLIISCIPSEYPSQENDTTYFRKRVNFHKKTVKYLDKLTDFQHLNKGK